MKLQLTLFALLLFCLIPIYHTNAQIGIGTTTPDANAALDIESTTQGVLIPRMTKAQRELIGGGTPAAGMLVYQTDETAGFYFYDGTSWTSLSAKTPSGLESIDEGNGNGLVIVGRDPANYGNVGLFAVDLSFSPSASTTYGATGAVTTALGLQTTASDFYAFATGAGTIASGKFSTAMGSFSIASGLGSIAMGTDAWALGDHSTSIGLLTRAESYFSTAIGTHNVGGGNPTTFIATDPLFEIGNGINDLNRSNALTVLKNGNVGINTSTPFYPLDVVGKAEINGDAYIIGNVGINTTLPEVELHVSGGTDASLSANSGFVQFGNTSGLNLVMDNNEIIARSNGGSSPLYLQSGSGNLAVGAVITPTEKLEVQGNIKSNGFVYANRIAFSAYLDNTYSINISSPFNFPGLLDVTDPYNVHNNGLFTAPRTGLYFFSTSLSFSNGDGLDDTMQMGFSVNDSASLSSEITINPRAFTADGEEQTNSHAMVLSLNQGDSVRVLIKGISDTTPVELLDRSFTGFYLGDL